MLDHLARDLRHTFRTFARHPGFALIAVVTIALGIGANTAIFSVVQAVLLRPLPYADADRLVLINGALTNRNIEYWATSPPDLRAFQEQVNRLDDLEVEVVECRTLLSRVRLVDVVEANHSIQSREGSPQIGEPVTSSAYSAGSQSYSWTTSRR